MMRAWTGLALLFLAISHHSASAETIKLAVIEDRAGRDAIAANHAEAGFRLGLDYATRGTLRVNGRSIDLATAEIGSDPETGARAMADACSGGTWLVAGFGAPAELEAMAHVAEQSHCPLLAMSSTLIAPEGATGNYSFRLNPGTGRFAAALIQGLSLPELNLAVVAEDTPAARGLVEAMKKQAAAQIQGLFVISTDFAPADGTGLEALLAPSLEALHGLHGARSLLTIWTDAQPPLGSIAGLIPEDSGIKLSFSGDLPTDGATLRTLPALEGVTGYFHTLPRNKANAWLVSHWQQRFHEAPDGYAAAGMAAAIAAVDALTHAPASDAAKLAQALERTRVLTPAGMLGFRHGDHGSTLPLYAFRTDAKAPVPILVRKIPAPPAGGNS